MHVPDGLLSPAVCAGTGLLSLGAIGYSLHRIRDEAAERTLPLTAMTAAVVFAGQMVNFPLLVVPISGHLIGGVLAGILIGPWAGCLALAAVLTVQCLMFADGGLMALGANILNMAVVGSIGGGLLYRSLRNSWSDSVRATSAAAFLAAVVSVIAAAGLFAIEFLLSHPLAGFDLSRILLLLVTIHLAIGVGEGIITLLLLRFLGRHRPEFLSRTATASDNETETNRPRWRGVFVSGAVTALAIATLLAPFASGHPDGLEAVAERTGMTDLFRDTEFSLLNDYEMPVPSGWTASPLGQAVSVALAGIAGCLVLLAGSLLRPPRTSPGSVTE